MRDYYPQFWELLKEFDYRLHWGKYLSNLPSTGPESLRARYPRWDDFMELREKMDPNQIFLTDYWRNYLGIPLMVTQVDGNKLSVEEPTKGQVSDKDKN